MLGKSSRQKIIKDSQPAKKNDASSLSKSQHQNGSAQRKTDGNAMSTTNLDNVGGSSADIFSIGEDITALEQYGITPEIYEKYKKMTD